MADEYKIQINSSINGDLVNMRGTSGEELAEVISGFAEHAGSIFKQLGDIKQAALANGVFSGNAPSAAPVPPRQSPAQTAPGVQPVCDRCGGPTKDCRGKRNQQGQPFKNRYYCAKFSCKGPGWGEWVE